jgi:nitrogen fixation protein FixH
MNQPAAAPRRSRWIPWIFASGFLLVVAVNGTMIAFALGTFSGLTTTEPYTKGLRFNDQIRHAQQQERLGWSVATRFDTAAPQSGELELRLAGRGGAPLTGARVSATFQRPLEKNRDFTVGFVAAGSGRYFARAQFPLPGAWGVTYRIEHEGEALEARDRLEVR